VIDYLFDWSAILKGIHLLMSAHWKLLFIVPLGLALGTSFGAIPGISVTLGMALILIPSLWFSPIVGIVFVSSVYTGGLYGGGITATILNIPGTAAGVPTTFDGYPMTKQGRQYEALGYGLLSSFIGTLIGWFIMFIAIKPIAGFVLLFGPAEMFMLITMAFVLIGVAGGEVLKSLLVGVLGLLIGTIGIDSLAVPRGNFGILELSDGVPFIASMVGLFALSEVFFLASGTTIVEKGAIKELKTPWSFLATLPKIIWEIRKFKVTVFRSTFIGVFIGLLPAAGANIASMLSYGQAKNSSKNKDRFGKGEPEGVVASEIANNASESGASATMLAFGIPGGTAAAILMAAMFMHGLTPGPYLLRDQMEFVYAIIISNFFQALLLIPIGCLFVAYMGRIVYIQNCYLIPTIIVLSILGGIAERGYLIDAVIVVVFGTIGYLLRKLGYPLISFILGILLAQTLDVEFSRAFRLYGHQPQLLLERPIFLLLFFIMAFALIVFTIQNRKRIIK